MRELAISFLYLLYAETQGQTIDLPGLEDLLVREIQARMNGLGASRSQILLAGWEDGHLRNAMAHMMLEYDAARELMHFTDRDRAGNPSYDNWLSLEQITRHVNLTKGGYDCFSSRNVDLGSQ